MDGPERRHRGKRHHRHRQQQRKVRATRRGFSRFVLGVYAWGHPLDRVAAVESVARVGNLRTENNGRGGGLVGGEEGGGQQAIHIMFWL